MMQGSWALPPSAPSRPLPHLVSLPPSGPLASTYDRVSDISNALSGSVAGLPPRTPTAEDGLGVPRFAPASSAGAVPAPTASASSRVGSVDYRALEMAKRVLGRHPSPSELEAVRKQVQAMVDQESRLMSAAPRPTGPTRPPPPPASSHERYPVPAPLAAPAVAPRPSSVQIPPGHARPAAPALRAVYPSPGTRAMPPPAPRPTHGPRPVDQMPSPTGIPRPAASPPVAAAAPAPRPGPMAAYLARAPPPPRPTHPHVVGPPVPRPAVQQVQFPTMAGVEPPPPNPTHEDMVAYYERLDRAIMEQTILVSQREEAKKKEEKRAQVKALTHIGLIMASGEFTSSVILTSAPRLLKFVRFLDSCDGKDMGMVLASRRSPAPSSGPMTPAAAAGKPTQAATPSVKSVIVVFSVHLGRVDGTFGLHISKAGTDTIVSGLMHQPLILPPNSHALSKHKAHNPKTTGAQKNKSLQKSGLIPECGDAVLLVDQLALSSEADPVRAFSTYAASGVESIMVRFARKYVIDTGTDEANQVPYNYDVDADIAAMVASPPPALPPPSSAESGFASPAASSAPKSVDWADTVTDIAGLRRAVVSLLLTEKQAIQWYPAPAKLYCADLVKRIDLDGVDEPWFGPHLIGLIDKENTMLKEGLVAMPSRPGCYPDILMAYNVANVATKVAEDGQIEIIDSDDDEPSVKRSKT